ncbi:hypothetical protein I131_07190 [Enterococcus faecium CRL1879]|nr:hypothetical protein HMPREF1347_01962 [Enterococcus faecium 504]ERK33829.1 hypothetical protein I131_07190 [Enterococcus faecium CRL1879]
MNMKNLSKVRQHKAPEGFHRLTSIIGIGMVTKKELRDDLPQLNSLDLLAARLY